MVESFGVEISDHGRRVTSTGDGAVETIEPVDLGCRSDGEQAGLVERDRTARHLLPSSVAVAYYDPERDYQAGRQTAASGQAGGRDVLLDTPVAIDAATAKGLAENVLSKAWARAQRLSLRLPPRFLGLVPGMKVQVQGDRAAVDR